MKWVTRKNASVDRIACPWLIKRFIDPDAEFLYLPAPEVAAVAEREGALPYDIGGVELGHVDGRCSFESIILKYGLEDPALDKTREAPDEPHRTATLAGDRSLEVEVLGKNSAHASRIEGRDSVSPTVVVRLDQLHGVLPHGVDAFMFAGSHLSGPGSIPVAAAPNRVR